MRTIHDEDPPFCLHRRREAMPRFLAKRDRCAFFQAQAENSRKSMADADLLTSAGMFQAAFDVLDELGRERPKLACIMAAEARCIQAVRRGDMANSAIVTARHFPS